MDFKIAGTKEGITAMQLDVKLRFVLRKGGFDTCREREREGGADKGRAREREMYRNRERERDGNRDRYMEGERKILFLLYSFLFLFFFQFFFLFFSILFSFPLYSFFFPSPHFTSLLLYFNSSAFLEMVCQPAY